MTTQQQRLNAVDVQVLRAVNRYRYLTAGQLNRLLWPNNTRDDGRYAQRRLAQLAQRGYLQVLTDLPRPVRGTAPRVYTPAWRGRQALVECGETVPAYYRPAEMAETARNAIFMLHTLAVIDVLIAADRLTHQVPELRLTGLLIERDLRRLSLKTVVPPAAPGESSHRVTVVPDALFCLSRAGTTQQFLLEVDRGTERQPAWRRKIAALTCWLASADSHSVLTTEYVTVMVVTHDRGRREQLRVWTQRELQTHGLFDEYASLFALTDASPVAMSPHDFFCTAHWRTAFTEEPDTLIDLPER